MTALRAASVLSSLAVNTRGGSSVLTMAPRQVALSRWTSPLRLPLAKRALKTTLGRPRKAAPFTCLAAAVLRQAGDDSSQIDHDHAGSCPGAYFQLKRASTGAWSLVPTSLWTRQAVARAANEMLTNT